MKDSGLVPGLLALVVVSAFCFFAVWIGLRAVPVANQHVIDITLGALVTQFANVVGYYFGSSKSAERAQSHIEAASTAAPSPTIAQVMADSEKKS